MMIFNWAGMTCSFVFSGLCYGERNKNVNLESSGAEHIISIFLLPSKYFRICHLMLTLSCLEMYVKMSAQPLYQSLTLTSYTQLKASAYLRLRVCHCLACTGVRILHQHQECPESP